MPDLFDELAQRASTLCLVREVDRTPRGHVRIQTAFMYPDGSFIDVFIFRDPTQPLLPPTGLTDLGQTMEFLINTHVKPWTSRKRKEQLEDAIALYGATMNGGKIEVPLEGPTRLQDSIVLLAQACLRASDLVFTKRVAMQADFSEDVESLLGDADLDYVPSATIDGFYGPVVVDFLVKGAHATSAVFSLSARLPSGAHGSTNEVFRKNHDLAKAQRPEQRVTILDDSVPIFDVFKKEDIIRLEEYSTVIPFSDKPQLLTALAA